MNEELVTEDGTYWDSDGEAIKLKMSGLTSGMILLSA